MKTDDEMIESLFRRRDEYYRKASEKHTVFAVLKVVGGIALPIAAAGAVALLMITAQKNAVTDGIGSDITEVPRSDAAQNMYSEEISPASEGEKKLSPEKVPLCFSFEGTIYAYDGETFAPEIYRSLKDKFFEAGTAATLDDSGRCTVYDMEGSDRKAVVSENNEVRLYKAAGSSSYTVEGIEFEIKALHRTAKNCRASVLPVFKEGEDVIFRAYDLSGNPVNDTFILYTPSLTAVTDNALWEVSSKYYYEPTYSTSIDLVNYSSLTAICKMVHGLTADKLIDTFGSSVRIVIDNEVIASGLQFYYTDLHRTEYVLEAYDNSDEIALTRIATGERIFISDPESDYRKFLSPESVPDVFKDEYEDTADKVSRLMEMYTDSTLTARELEEAGFEASEIYRDRYEIFYTKNGKECAAAVFMDENGEPERFIAVDAEEYYEYYCDDAKLVSDSDYIFRRN